MTMADFSLRLVVCGNSLAFVLLMAGSSRPSSPKQFVTIKVDVGLGSSEEPAREELNLLLLAVSMNGCGGKNNLVESLCLCSFGCRELLLLPLLLLSFFLLLPEAVVAVALVAKRVCIDPRCECGDGVILKSIDCL